MKEITFAEAQFVSGSLAISTTEMTKAETSKSWARTFGVLAGFAGVGIGGTFGMVPGISEGNPALALAGGAIGAGAGAIVSYSVTSAKLTLKR